MSARKHDIALRLHAAAIHLLRAVWTEDRRTGLTRARLSVLSVLVFGGPRTLTQLTDIEQVAAPTMTKLIAGLERDGYVRRKPDAADGRVWVIHATPRAVRLMHKGRERRIESVIELLKDVPVSQWETIEHAVTILENALHRGVAP